VDNVQEVLNFRVMGVEKISLLLGFNYGLLETFQSFFLYAEPFLVFTYLFGPDILLFFLDICSYLSTVELIRGLVKGVKAFFLVILVG